MKRVLIGFCFLAMTLPLSAGAADILFDIEARRVALQQPDYVSLREACLAAGEKESGEMPEPIKALRSTPGYGSDNRPEAFTWYVMLRGGRALAGDKKAASELREVLLRWARAEALTESEISHDTYYAIKRYLLPVMVNYAIIAEDLPKSKRKIIEAWIDRLVRPLDKQFDGDVDRNNHRILADSALMAWGAFTGDAALVDKGVQGFHHALAEAEEDGGLPLETRRGARAIWYQRHAIASLVLIAEIAKQKGDDLYAAEVKGVSLETLMNYFLTAHFSSVKVLPKASENYIPGPHADYLAQDLAYLKRRDHGRHYMAFAEAYVQQRSFAAERLRALMQRTGFKERPLIDEYMGGNTTCFFTRP